MKRQPYLSRYFVRLANRLEAFWALRDACHIAADGFRLGTMNLEQALILRRAFLPYAAHVQRLPLP